MCSLLTPHLDYVDLYWLMKWKYLRKANNYDFENLTVEEIVG